MRRQRAELKSERQIVQTTDDLAHWRSVLRHVRWIGGPPDSGKTTIANLLGHQFRLPVYHQDRHERDHLARADPQRHPAMTRIRQQLQALDERELLDWLWLSQPVDAMARSAFASWSERIDLVQADLAAMPAGSVIIAEGPGFFPDVIDPLLNDRSQAIWLLPTADFKRASHERRGKSQWRGRTSDPDRALANHLARDLALIELYRAAIETRQFPRIIIDGTQDASIIASRVANHFRLANPAVGP